MKRRNASQHKPEREREEKDLKFQHTFRWMEWTNMWEIFEKVIHILDLIQKYLKLSTKIFWVQIYIHTHKKKIQIQKYIILSTKIFFRSSTRIY